MARFSGIVVVFVFLYTVHVQGGLEPTKIMNNGLYRLEIQSEDKFLTSSDNGTPLRSRWANRPDQKWKFTAVSGSTEKGWMLTPNAGAPIPTLWKISYVGHGKYRFLNEISGLCLAGSGSNTVGERACEKDSPYQRWLVLETKP